MLKRVVKDLETYILNDKERPKPDGKAMVLFIGKGNALLNGKEVKEGTAYFSIDDHLELELKEGSKAFLNCFDISSQKDFIPFLQERYTSYSPEKTNNFPLFYRIIEEEKDDDMFYYAVMLELRINLIEARNEFLTKFHNDFSIQKVLEYIDLHIREKMSVSSLADIFYYHPAYFSYKFKTATNKNLVDYIREKKCEGVISLYQQGVSLHKASEEYGFENYPTFYRTYKAIYGSTPNQLERKIS